MARLCTKHLGAGGEAKAQQCKLCLLVQIRTESFVSSFAALICFRDCGLRLQPVAHVGMAL